MNRKAIIVAAALIVVTGTALYVRSNNSSDQAASSLPQTENISPESSSQKGKPINIVGKIICLSPKDTTGPQNLSCAIGLLGEDGKSYALSTTDPTLTGSLPTGQRIRVTGMVAGQATQYTTAGIIKVHTVERL